MTCGFLIAYAFTGEIKESAGITVVIGPTLMLVQWGFEVAWDRYIRENFRNAISREQGGVSWLVRWGRGSRSLGVDINEQGADRGEAGTNSRAATDASRERT